jgi:hypothetical protein
MLQFCYVWWLGSLIFWKHEIVNGTSTAPYQLHINFQSLEQKTNSSEQDRNMCHAVTAGRILCLQKYVPVSEQETGTWASQVQVAEWADEGHTEDWTFPVLLSGTLSQRPAPHISSHRHCHGAILTLAIRLCLTHSSSSRNLVVP